MSTSTDPLLWTPRATNVVATAAAPAMSRALLRAAEAPADKPAIADGDAQQMWTRQFDTKWNELNQRAAQIMAKTAKTATRTPDKRSVSVSVVSLASTPSAPTEPPIIMNYDDFRAAFEAFLEPYRPSDVTQLLEDKVASIFAGFLTFHDSLDAVVSLRPAHIACLVWGVLFVVLKCGCIFSDFLNTILDRLANLSAIVGTLRINHVERRVTDDLENILLGMLDGHLDFCLVVVRFMTDSNPWPGLRAFQRRQLSSKLQNEASQMEQYLHLYRNSLSRGRSLQEASSLLISDEHRSHQRRMTSIGRADDDNRKAIQALDRRNTISVAEAYALTAARAALSPETPVAADDGPGGDVDDDDSDTLDGVETSRAQFPVVTGFQEDGRVFVGRSQPMKELYDLLIAGTEPGSRSRRPAGLITCNIYGVQAIGKSRLAAMFVHTHKKHYDGVFWVNADRDSGMETLRTYCDIGRVLQLAAPGDELSDAHIAPVWRWLQTTRRRWIVVFDNYVEDDLSRIQRFWPTRALASSVVLVTSQKPVPTSLVPDSHRIELLSLDDVTGSDLLLHDLPRSDPVAQSSVRRAEDKLARRVVHELGGSPLFLLQGQVVMTETASPTLHEKLLKLLAIFPVQFVQIHNMYGRVTQDENAFRAKVEALCIRLAKTLGQPATRLLNMLAFMGPDDMDEELFVSESKQLVHGDVLPDIHTYHQSIRRLMRCNLVHRVGSEYVSPFSPVERPASTDHVGNHVGSHVGNGSPSGASSISAVIAPGSTATAATVPTQGSTARVSLRMHRSTKNAVLARLNDEPFERETAFDNVMRVLRCHFRPTSAIQIANANTQRMQARVLPHILSAANAFEDALKTVPPIRGTLVAANLIGDVGGIDLYDRRFLQETYKLTHVAETIYDQLHYPQQSKHRSDILAVRGLCCDSMALSRRQDGRLVRIECLAIRKTLHAAIPAEDVSREDIIRLYNAHMDLACSYQQINDFHEVVPLLEACHAAYQQLGPEDEPDLAYEYAKYYNQMAYVRLWEGQGDAAVALAARAAALVERAAPGTNMSLVFRADHAHLLFQNNQRTKAAQQMRQLLKEAETTFGKNSMQSLEFRLNLGIVLYFLNHLYEAEDDIRTSLEDASKLSSWPLENTVRGNFYLSRVLSARAVEEPAYEAKADEFFTEAKDNLERLRARYELKIGKHFNDNLPMMFDYLVHWENRLVTPRKSEQEAAEQSGSGRAGEEGTTVED